MPRTRTYPLLGAERRDSWYFGKLVSSAISLHFFLLFFFVSPPPWTGGGRCFKCLTDQYLPPYLFSGIFCNNKTYSEQQIDKRPRGVLQTIPCRRDRPANIGFLPLKVRTFWVSVVWFHPGGEKSGRSRPALRTNQVFLFTEVSLTVCGLLCVFRCNTTPGWNLTGFFLHFYFSYPEKRETARGAEGSWGELGGQAGGQAGGQVGGQAGGQVDELTFLYLLSFIRTCFIQNLLHCVPQRTPHTGKCTFIRWP